jgi:hypothetical protein
MRPLAPRSNRNPPRSNRNLREARTQQRGNRALLFSILPARKIRARQQRKENAHMTSNQPPTTPQDATSAIRAISQDELRLAAGGVITQIPIKVKHNA